MPVTLLDPTESDQSMSRLMVELWANFAAYRDPTPPERKATLGEAAGAWPSSRVDPQTGHASFVTLKNGKVEEGRWDTEKLDFWQKAFKEVEY